MCHPYTVKHEVRNKLLAVVVVMLADFVACNVAAEAVAAKKESINVDVVVVVVVAAAAAAAARIKNEAKLFEMMFQRGIK